ncbi:MAG: hypothetical protein ACFB4I_16980 [Cyanophyceae cyanobacterium]
MPRADLSLKIGRLLSFCSIYRSRTEIPMMIILLASAYLLAIYLLLTVAQRYFKAHKTS